MKNLHINVKDEKGASSALALITVLMFASILTAILIVILTRAQGQIKSDIRIQEIYGNEVERADEIYNEVIEDEEQTNEKVKSNVKTKSYIFWKVIFITKKYNSTSGHQLYKITEITENG